MCLLIVLAFLPPLLDFLNKVSFSLLTDWIWSLMFSIVIPVYLLARSLVQKLRGEVRSEEDAEARPVELSDPDLPSMSMVARLLL